jgi:hypothetical protein
MGRAMVDSEQPTVRTLIIKAYRVFRNVRDRSALRSVLSPTILDCDRGDGGTDLVETVVL